MTNPNTTPIHLDDELTDTEIGLMDSVRQDYRNLIDKYALNALDDEAAWREGQEMHAHGDAQPRPMGFERTFDAARNKARLSRYRGFKHAEITAELESIS